MHASLLSIARAKRLAALEALNARKSDAQAVHALLALKAPEDRCADLPFFMTRRVASRPDQVLA